MHHRLPALALLLALLAGPAGAAFLPGDRLADPAAEARAQALGREIRCMVCQGQSIEDSEADLARDLRRLVRERIEAGDSDAAIRRFLHERYGDFVLLRPPLSAFTLLLWASPLLALALGLAVILARRRQPPPAPAPLSPEEQARLERIIRGR
ncbi:MAG: cytochrome c-type biogenesis protein CcmH [Rhodovarius sp.]|nr:cytochrome c-type biogenesis protein CcmH [Rhodovarius sp.]